MQAGGEPVREPAPAEHEGTLRDDDPEPRTRAFARLAREADDRLTGGGMKVEETRPGVFTVVATAHEISALLAGARMYRCR